MKNNIMSVVMFTLLLTPAVWAQFEGEIDMKSTHHEKSDRQILLSLFIKQDMVAVKSKESTEGGKERNARVIYRSDKNMAWIVDDERKSYFELPVGQDLKGAGTTLPKPTAEEGNKPSVHKTGKTETILGYACDEWIVEIGDVVADVWGTSKLGNVYEGITKSLGQQRQKERSGSRSQWRDELAKMKIVPLRTTVKLGGELSETEEVTNIESKSIPASTFELPSEYTKQSFRLPPGMMKGGENADMQKLMQEMRQKMKDNNAGENPEMKKMLEKMQEDLKQKKEQSDTAKDSDN